LILALAAAAAGWAFVPPARSATRLRQAVEVPAARVGSHTRLSLSSALPLLLVSAPAEAAGEDFAGALVAYGHYSALILATACLTAERLTIKAGMTQEEETRMQIADSLYGVAGLLTVVTGYLRSTTYGKGWEFYQHEPIFWLKVTLVAIAGASSFFVTAMIVKRKREANERQIAPVSEKLAKRMTSIINAELLAIGSIPLTATLMARGVGYAEWFPWQAGAAPAVLALGGLGFKYVKEALDWTEDNGPKA